MSSSLGIYIDENIIKYAKISREGDNIKVDALGIKYIRIYNKQLTK